MRLLLANLPAALLTAAALAQAPGAHWSTVQGIPNPPQRRENPGAADVNNFYVFGGRSGGSGGVPMNDLWRFDGAGWTLMTADGAVGSPPARDLATVTWDFNRNRLVVFGGRDVANVTLGDTWEWDPLTNLWSAITPVGGSPSPRTFAATTFDPVNGKVLLFGGLDAGGAHLADTWTWDGSAWTQLSPAGALPPVRRQHHLVTRFDFLDVLLFGGQDATLSSPANWRLDTWRWDGSQWLQIVTANYPNGQVANDAAYDAIRQRVVLAGGNGIGGSPTGTIAEFDSLTNDWVVRPLDAGIYKVSRYFAAFVPALGKTFKASGQALNATRPPTETYAYQTDVAAAFVPLAGGCATSAGIPMLRSPRLPWLGRTFSLEVANTPATAVTLIAIGASTTAIPLSLLGLGAPGCVITVQPILGVPAPPATGTGLPTLDLPMPTDTALAGIVLLTQAIVVDGANGGVSNQGDATIGAL
ncbi:MAG: hypothetical protein IPM29_16145 [Planctomycetes bacterium]|nr:hypothetical protein [Planctomycetota bacterium]